MQGHNQNTLYHQSILLKCIFITSINKKYSKDTFGLPVAILFVYSNLEFWIIMEIYVITLTPFNFLTICITLTPFNFISICEILRSNNFLHFNSFIICQSIIWNDIEHDIIITYKRKIGRQNTRPIFLI